MPSATLAAPAVNHADPLPDRAPAALVYTLPEAAAVLKVCPESVRRLVARRKLRVLPGLRHLRIPASSINSYLSATR